MGNTCCSDKPQEENFGGNLKEQAQEEAKAGTLYPQLNQFIVFI